MSSEKNLEEQANILPKRSPKAIARHQWYASHKRFAITIAIINTSIVTLGFGASMAMFLVGLNKREATKKNYDQVSKVETLQANASDVGPLIYKYADNTTGAIPNDTQKVFQEIKNYLLDFGYFNSDKNLNFTLATFNQAVRNYSLWDKNLKTTYTYTVYSFSEVVYNDQIPAVDTQILVKFAKQLEKIDMDVYASQTEYTDAFNFTYIYAIFPFVGSIFLFIGVFYLAGIKQRRESKLSQT